MSPIGKARTAKDIIPFDIVSRVLERKRVPIPGQGRLDRADPAVEHRKPPPRNPSETWLADSRPYCCIWHIRTTPSFPAAPGPWPVWRKEHNWQIHIASMTPGEELRFDDRFAAAKISRHSAEEGERTRQYPARPPSTAWKNATLVDVAYHEPVRLEKAVRNCSMPRPGKPSCFTHSPADYLLDHEMTSVIARAAAFGAPTPNLFCDRGHELPLEPHSSSLLLRSDRGQRCSGPAGASRLLHRYFRRGGPQN